MFNCKPDYPGNNKDLILVNSKEGKHCRRKRGTVKPATLNNAFLLANESLKTISPAAAKIASSVRSYLRNFKTGRLNNRISTCLRKSFKETSHLQFAYLKGLQFQKEHPLERMVSRYVVQQEHGNINIKVDIGKDYIIPQNNVVTDYYFEAILVYGDLITENGLITKSVESPLYSFNSNEQGKCCLELPHPRKYDWMLLLKISCLEGDNLASHTKHYRLKVIATKPPNTSQDI
jgi:hypothetical protein